jgi:hypothetical protein
MIRHNNHIDHIAHIGQLDSMEVQMQHKHFEDVQQQTNVRLTPMAQKLLNMLREHDDWINRSGLAQKIQKTALNKWDVVLLNKLSERDFIEIRKVRHHGPIGYEWQYRAIQSQSSSESGT